MTLRTLQKSDDQWARAKGFDGSGPLGPWIETDLDPNDVTVETRLNGEVRQHDEHDRPGLRRRDVDRIHHRVHDAAPRRRDHDRHARGGRQARPGRRRRGRGGRARRAREPGPMSEGAVRCRFAPAPSGSLHVGNVRSALFSWLFARHEGGAFVLRVEDTDASRVTEEAVAGVLEDLRWLGLEHDEGPDVGGPHAPYRQSLRLDIYREQADRLLAQGAAYRCYCTSEELEQRREAAKARGEAPGYDGHCRDLGAERVAAYESEGRSAVVRFRMPDREWVVDDIVKGAVHFAPGQLRDFVLVRSDGSPVFLLAVAVDDMVDGHHPRRARRRPPRERAAQRRRDRGIGGAPPRYAHVPQVLGPGPAAAVETSRVHERGVVPGTGVPARGDGELPGPARMVAGRRPGGPLARGADRGVRPRPRLARTRPRSTPRSSRG